MKHVVQHVTVLGGAIAVAAAIILVSGSRSGAPRARGAPPRAVSPGKVPAGKASPGTASAPVRPAAARGSPAVEPEPGESGLEAAERHFHAAAELYRDGAGRDDAQEDMKLARRRLDEAQRILAQLPAEAPRVKDLRLKVQELLQNVIKDSGL